MRTTQDLQACVDVALRRRPADLLIRGARLFDLATGELAHANLALAGDRIAAVGEGYEGRETLDARGLTAVPGFVDAHCHIESSLLTPYEWERLVLPHGVTAAVCDPHELANVAGRAAIDYFRACAAGMLLRLQVQIPSCVPALPSEEAGARLPAEAIAPYARDAALAEFMNVPGVLGGDPDALAKLAAFSGRPIDGHAPLASGDALNALCAVGIANDHETCSVPEALEKLRRGMTLLIRAGSVAKNLEALAPLLTLTLCDRLCLCTDDRDPLDVRDEGHLDAAIRAAIAQGCDPLAVYRAACLTPARAFGWRGRGLLAPGHAADVVLLEDLAECRVAHVVCRGRVVGEAAFAARPPAPDDAPFRGSVRCRPLTPADFASRRAGGRAIAIAEGTLLTRDVPAEGDGLALAALVERHGGSGRVGLAWAKGFGLKAGALASTVGHDSHNLCVVGTTPEDMAAAAEAVRAAGGGFAVAAGGVCRACLPLPIGGLMSDRPAAEVADALAALRRAAREASGTPLANPFLALAFLPLPVIPEARLTLEGFTHV